MMLQFSNCEFHNMVSPEDVEWHDYDNHAIYIAYDSSELGVWSSFFWFLILTHDFLILSSMSRNLDLM